MVRDSIRILTFRRLTELGNIRPVALMGRSIKRLEEISQKIDDPNFDSFARPYLYVAMASCLEVDLKYKARTVIDTAENDIEVFRRLYGEAKIDVNLLFHVIRDSISLGDLVSEATAVSDVKSLIHRSELVLNALSGSSGNFVYRLQQLLAEISSGNERDALELMISRYDRIARDIEQMFEIRHVIVHDIFSGQKSVQDAMAPSKLSDVCASCTDFLQMFNALFLKAFTTGPWRAEEANRRREAEFKMLANEAHEILASLEDRFPSAKKELEQLNKNFETLIDRIAKTVHAFAGDSKQSRLLSPHMCNTFFMSWWKIVRAIQFESTFL
jgi:hypothetical protein